MSVLAPARSEPVAALCARAMAARHRDPAEARELATHAHAAARDSGDDALELRAAVTLGACLSADTDGVERGRALLADALARCESAGDDALRCDALLELAASYMVTYEMDEARRHAAGAVELARRTARPAAEVRALRLAGNVEMRVGEFGAALTTLLAALSLHESLAPAAVDGLADEARWERGELFSAIAAVYSNMDEFTRALHYYGVALDSFGDRFPASTARTLFRMGIAGDEMEDWDTAERYYRQALAAYDALGDEAGRALGMKGLSLVLLNRGRTDEAEVLAERALAALADPVHVGYYSDAWWMLGDVRLRQGRPAEALECYQRARGLFEQTRRPDAHWAHLHLRFSNVYEAMGRWEEALREHQRHHALRERQLQEQAATRLAAVRVQFDTERAMKDAEIHRLRTIELEREIAERREAEAALARAQAELQARNAELQALAIRDPLTGAFNRRYLDQRLDEAMPLAVRGIQPLSVMMCDLDDFKRVNDTFSHAVGDRVLQEVATLLRRHLRQSDVVARFGGEEFMVLFPATTLEQAAAAAHKVCAVVREHAWAALHPGLAVTLSAGVAEAAGHPTHEKLLSQADARLYEAKRRGKDQVVA